MKKYIAIIAAFLTFGAVQAQTVEQTGNLVQPTVAGTNVTPWNNAVYQSSLTCFAWGNPGYCGPNPIATPGLNLNFSYGWTDVYQQQSIASVLPNSGTGLRVDGYNFGFRAKNGNGWDDGRVDVLYAYVQFNDPQGGTLLNHTHNLTYKFNWTDFAYSYNFDTPMPAKDIGSVRYGFVGKDNNFWAGPYGPEVANINFSLRYSVDPCATNPLHSASCSGFSAALASITPSQVSTVSTATTDVVPSPTATPTLASAAPSNPPAPVANPATNAAGSNTPVTRSTNPSTVSFALNLINRNQQREQNIVSQTIQSATTLASESAENAQRDAVAVATQTMQTSIAVAVPGLGGQGLRTSTSAVNNGYLSSDAVVSVPALPVLDRSNPLNEYMEPKASMPAAVAPATGPAVNTKAADNEAAGGVDISRMALAPTGFADYTNFTLRDTAFYAPREVYRNQRTVDNARALRQLSSDRLHQLMVEQQYK